MQFVGNKKTGKVWLLTWYLVINTSFCLAQAHMIYDLDILRFTEILLSHAMLETDTSIYICNIYAAPFSFIPGLWKPREPRCHLGSPRIANFSLTNFHQRSGVEMPWYFLSFNLSVFWKSSWFEMISKKITAALYIFVIFLLFCKFPWNSGKSWNKWSISTCQGIYVVLCSCLYFRNIYIYIMMKF